MPGVPSNKACERCKKRHLKCDETRPSCQRCIGAGVECPGYVQTRKFIDQGATIRRRYAPYQETHPKPSTASDSSKATAAPQNAKQQGKPLEKQHLASSSETHDSSTLHLQMEGANLGSQDEPIITQTPGLANEPGMSMQTNFLEHGSVPSPSSHVSAVGGSSLTTSTTTHGPVSLNVSTGAFGGAGNGFNAMLGNRLDNRRLISSENSPQRSEKEEFQDIFTEFLSGTEHEIAFLTRHFSEVIGPWLDLSDTEKFFAVYVPIRALNNLSLKYAIAALAAKHLGRIKGAKSPTGGGLFTSPATMEIYPNATQVDWFLKAANYYYMAASELNKLTSEGYTPISSSAILASPIETVGRWLSAQAEKDLINFAGEEPDDLAMLRKTEDLLAVPVLLTFCKLMDTSGEEWSQQLWGIQSVFDSISEMYMASPYYFSHGIRAAFWNFARQDYLGAYLSRSSTRLNPEYHPLWRAAGISIRQEKFYVATGGTNRSSQEDQAANGLVWLNSKVVTFLAKSKQSQLAQWTGSSPATSPGPATPGQQPYPDTNTWLSLCFDFQTWLESAPETIRPCVRIEHPKDLSNLSSSSEANHLPFPEIYFSLPTCAAAMQHYHFGRIALLLNRPPDVVSAPSTAFDRLQGYREVTKEVEYRCREVCGIALGRPPGGVRIYMVPLLFAVGQCLERAEERQIIVDLLRGVEADLGWPTEYAVQKLLASWNR